MRIPPVAGPAVYRTACALTLLLGASSASAIGPATAAVEPLVVPDVVSAPFTGDLPEIRERGVLRALVSPSRTDFFLQGARPRGIMVELVQQYIASLNEGLDSRELPLTVKYVLVPFDELIPALLEGRGDVAVANLTVTPSREAKVAFVRGKQENVDELLVTHADVEGIASVADLAGRRVTVLSGSSYAEHLRALSETLVADGAAPIEVREADSRLVTEDILELVNAGVYDLTVADDYRARLWARVLPRIVVREDVKVNEGGTLGWAVRKTNPKLLAALEKAAPDLRAGSLIGNTLLKRYYGSTRWIRNPLAASERRKLERLLGHIQKYAERYELDWLAVAAQGYQESGLDQSVRSPSGAIGVMQLLPSTAADEHVGIPDISNAEDNIHAGVKYLAFLRDHYFDDPELAEEDRVAFSWAAYNAGPSRVQRMREKAQELGLDPDRWYGNVEHAALALVGQEPVRYVRNIYKYYLAYSSFLAGTQARRALVGEAKASARKAR